MATDLIFVRHGQTTLNAERRMAGWTDSPLASSGVEQARLVGAHVVASYPLDRVYCSPLQRTMATARAFADPLGHDLILLDDLREMYFGECEALTVAEIQARYPDAPRDPGALIDHFFVWPGGESLDGFFARVRAVVRRIVDESPDMRVAVVTHGAVIGTLVAEIVAGDPFRWRKYVPRNCSITEIRAEGGELSVVRHDDWSFMPESAVDPIVANRR